MKPRLILPLKIGIGFVITGFFFLGCSLDGSTGEGPDSGGEIGILIPSDFPALPYPSNNVPIPAKIELGRRLFYDVRLSQDLSTACASCHRQNTAFTDSGRALSLGIHGQSGSRNAPTLVNVAYGLSFFAAGGVPTLEQQAIGPITNPVEMDMNTDSLARRIDSVLLYKSLFKQAWGNDSITFGRITKSLASFERSIISGQAPYDKWLHGDSFAISASAKRGVKLFFGEKGDCFHCHGGFNFTDQGFHNTGLDSVTVDAGRFTVTSVPSDEGKFKTPTLRNIAVTAPYMHDGRFADLRHVVLHYNSGGKPHPNRDALMRPLGLSENDIIDLVEFLKTLTDSALLKNPDYGDPWKG